MNMHKVKQWNLTLSEKTKLAVIEQAEALGLSRSAFMSMCITSTLRRGVQASIRRAQNNKSIQPTTEEP